MTLKLLRLYDTIVLGRPRLIVASLLTLFAFCAYWIKDFQLDASSDSLVLEHDEDLRYARQVQERYGGAEFVVVTFTPAGELLGKDSLRTLKELRGELSSLPRVESVTSLLDVPLLRNPPVPLTEVQSNLKTLEDPGASVELARKELQTSPVYQGLLVSEDLKSTTLQVNFRADEDHAKLTAQRIAMLEKRREGDWSTAEDAELSDLQRRYSRSKDRLRDELHADIESIRGILDGYRGKDRLYLGGVPMIVDDIVTFIRSDLMIFGVGMILLLLATLGVIFRRLRWVVLPMLCCACSALVMMGLLGFLGWEVTVVSSNFVSLQLIFTMSLTIHLIVRFREFLRTRSDLDNRALIRETVGHTFVPCLYASLTTIAGFSSLIVCDILPVSTFGWMMTLGILVSLTVTFVLFPAASMLVRKPPAAEESDFGLPLTSFFGRLTERRGPLILVGSAVVAIVTVVGTQRLKVENSFIDYFKESTEIYQGMEFIDRELGGTTPLDVILDFGVPRDSGSRAGDGEVAALDRPDSQQQPAPANPDPDFDEFVASEPLGDPQEAERQEMEEFDEFSDLDEFAEFEETDDFGDFDEFDEFSSSSGDDDFDDFDDFDDSADFGDDEFGEFEDSEQSSAEARARAREEEKAKYWFTSTKLDRIGRVHDYLDALPETGKVLSLATLTKVGLQINDGEPLDDLLIAILFQKMPQDFRDALIAPYASVSNDQARISVRIKDSLETLRRDALLKQIRGDLKDELGLRDDQFRVSGLMVLYNNMLQSLFQSQIKTIGYTVLALMVMFLFLFRSLKISLIAIVPSLLSSLAILGVMGLAGIPLDVMTITIVAISVGIAVDDTIHYLHRFKKELAVDGSYLQAMHRSHRSIGNAMYYTSITITTGFSILAFSNFVPSILFGLLTALAMMMALVSSLTLLPRLILVVRPFGVGVVPSDSS